MPIQSMLEIGGQSIAPGSRVKLELPVAQLATGTPVAMPIQVIRSRKPGPVVFVSAAIHGDELNGVEIIRRLIAKAPKITAGSLIMVPMVNVFGVHSQSRYTPDRRDLNRTFPGSEKGSLAGRLAHIFMTEIVDQCDYGIDLHTGAIHRSNLPQIRANLKDPETRQLAEAFGVPVILNSELRDGSLRQIAADQGTRILLYEAGEALRFDELSIRAGVKGVQNVLAALGMMRKRSRKATPEPFAANKSHWLRAPVSGIVRDLKRLGDWVEAGEALAEIGDPYGEVTATLYATRSGVIIGQQNIPLVQEGDAMVHVAMFDEEDMGVADSIELMQDTLLDSPVS
ncbi:succinylglutamate desuccinylase/aspartoacylase family protein [Thalassolituus maritimus]|uniref:M14 family metallopeptidase n=1 Tax=Thalassolituus maritimus TaxID=484498 RepID=A0ABQ0A0T0_9GAMM